MWVLRRFAFVESAQKHLSCLHVGHRLKRASLSSTSTNSPEDRWPCASRGRGRLVAFAVAPRAPHRLRSPTTSARDESRSHIDRGRIHLGRQRGDQGPPASSTERRATRTSISDERRARQLNPETPNAMSSERGFAPCRLGIILKRIGAEGP